MGISRENVSCNKNDFQISDNSNSLIFTSKRMHGASWNPWYSYVQTSLEWIPLVVTYKNYDFAFFNAEADVDDRRVYKVQFKALNKNNDGFCSLTFNGEGRKAMFPFQLVLLFDNAEGSSTRYTAKDLAFGDIEIINIPARELIDKIREKRSNNLQISSKKDSNSENVINLLCNSYQTGKNISNWSQELLTSSQKTNLQNK